MLQRHCKRFEIFWLAKKLKIATRHSLSQSPRDVPKPNLPYGGAHKLSNNYYVSRDTRRSVLPPLKISSTQELIGANQESAKPRIIPGDVYHPRP